MAAFHFLRPEWLLALVPALLVAGLCWRRLAAGDGAWTRLVDPHLLRHLALAETGSRRRWPALLLLAGLALATLAMAGPAWEKLPVPALERREPTVVVLSLAQSMNATDQPPSRLAVARHKVEDILKRMQGAQVGLVIFADAPFVAAPLTEDGRVVGQMLPELATDLMPVLDNRPDLAIARAAELLKGAGAPNGRIVLVTDETGDVADRTEAAAAAAAREGYPVSVIGVGSAAGSPLLTFAGTPIRAADGSELRTRMDAAALTRLATAGGGVFAPLSADDRDLDRVLADGRIRSGGMVGEPDGLSVDQWADMGPWLLLLVVPMAALAFRRGWIAVLLLAALPGTLLLPRAAAAAEAPERWRNLWQTPDQQGADAFGRADFGGAATTFEDPEWRAGSLYRAGDYEAAAAAYARVPGGDYNRGNALARANRLEDALAAYDAALKADPDHLDAFHNRELVRKLLEKKKDEEQKQDQQKKDQQKQGGGGGGGQDKDGQGKPDQSKPDQGKGGQSGGPNKEGQGKDSQAGQGPPNPAQPPDQNKSDPSRKPGERKPEDQKPGDQGPGTPPPPRPGEGANDRASPDKPQDPGAAGKPNPPPPRPQSPPLAPPPAGGQTPPQPQAPPGETKPPPGEAKTPPAEAKEPPGQPQPPPGETKTPPGQAKSPPGQDKSPPGQPRPPADPPAAASQPPQAPPPGSAGAGPRPPADGPPPQDGAAGRIVPRSQAEADQTREQMLRMVPDDPAGLLRARIRSHYENRPPAGEGGRVAP